MKRKASVYLKKITELLKSSKEKKNVVHVMGEFTFVYSLITMLKKKKITVIASTTERIVKEAEGKKIVTFSFTRFREY